jgi:YHS domain-containing protein
MKIIPILAIVLFASCSSNEKKPEHLAAPTTTQNSESKLIKIDPKLLAMQTDTVCGMDLKYGVADTLTADGKIYGFCSSSCKNEFVAQLAKQVK